MTGTEPVEPTTISDPGYAGTQFRSLWCFGADFRDEFIGQCEELGTLMAAGLGGRYLLGLGSTPADRHQSRTTEQRRQERGPTLVRRGYATAQDPTNAIGAVVNAVTQSCSSDGRAVRTLPRQLAGRRMWVR